MTNFIPCNFQCARTTTAHNFGCSSCPHNEDKMPAPPVKYTPVEAMANTEHMQLSFHSSIKMETMGNLQVYFPEEKRVAFVLLEDNELASLGQELIEMGKAMIQNAEQKVRLRC